MARKRFKHASLLDALCRAEVLFVSRATLGQQYEFSRARKRNDTTRTANALSELVTAKEAARIWFRSETGLMPVFSDCKTELRELVCSYTMPEGK